MDKKILLIFCMLTMVSTLWAQVYDNNDETTD